MRGVRLTGVQRFGDGRVLLGGAPTRLFRLSAAGAAALDRWCAGEPLAGGAETDLAWRLVDAGMAEPTFDGPDDGDDADGDVPERLTVVVATHGRARQLDVGVALLRSAHPTGRIVVVDDGSPDASAIASVAARHHAELLRRERSGGPAAARNTGLAAVTTPLVAFVDSDVEVAPGWDRTLRRWCALDGVAIVAPRVISPPGPSTRRRYDSLRSPLDLGDRSAAVYPGGQVSYVPAAALVARTDVMVALGGFDESMPVGEDVDLVWRAHEAGWRIRYEPAVAVVHREPVERAAVGAWVGRRVAYGSSAAVLERRHRGAAPPVVVSGSSAFVWGLVAAGHPLAAAAVGGTSAAALTRKLAGVPTSAAVAVGLRGHLRAGEALLRSLVRPWWPLSVVAAVRLRRCRTVLAIAIVVPPLIDRSRAGRRQGGGSARPPIGSWIGWHLLDDVAYSTGVWWGAVRARSPSSLQPRRAVRSRRSSGTVSDLTTA